MDDQDDTSRGVQERTREVLQSPLASELLRGVGAGLAIANRNWRSPGFRLVGLRRVDARTGGPVSVRDVLTGVLFDQARARQAATRPLFRSRAHRQRDRLRELAPRLEEIKHSYEGDLQAQQRALTEFYKANQVNPLAGCGWLAAGPILSQMVLAFAIRNGRTAYDSLTGTLVTAIVDAVRRFRSARKPLGGRFRGIGNLAVARRFDLGERGHNLRRSGIS